MWGSEPLRPVALDPNAIFLEGLRFYGQYPKVAWSSTSSSLYRSLLGFLGLLAFILALWPLFWSSGPPFWSVGLCFGFLAQVAFDLWAIILVFWACILAVWALSFATCSWCFWLPRGLPSGTEPLRHDKASAMEGKNCAYFWRRACPFWPCGPNQLGNAPCFVSSLFQVLSHLLGSQLVVKKALLGLLYHYYRSFNPGFRVLPNYIYGYHRVCTCMCTSMCRYMCTSMAPLCIRLLQVYARHKKHFKAQYLADFIPWKHFW